MSLFIVLVKLLIFLYNIEKKPDTESHNLFIINFKFHRFLKLLIEISPGNDEMSLGNAEVDQGNVEIDRGSAENLQGNAEKFQGNGEKNQGNEKITVRWWL